MELSGIYCPITTPFVNDKVAPDKLAENLQKWNATKLNGYVILGSTGETVYLSKSEKVEAIKCALANRARDKKIIIGTGHESTAETIRFTKLVADYGVDGALVVTPHYYKNQMIEDSLYRYYISVADNSPIPILIYNVPKFTGLDISPSLVRKLAPHPNILGIKDSSNKMSHLTELIKDSTSNFHVLIGNYTLLLPGFLIGAKGAILAFANVAPYDCVEIYRLFSEKSYNQARKLYLRLIPLAKALTSTYGIPAIKAALDLLGFYGGKPREPLLTLSQEKIDEIYPLLKEAKLL